MDSKSLKMPENLTEQAAALLKNGNVVAVPTETVYGLACDAENENAIAQVFALKGRPQDNPLILHACDLAMVEHFFGPLPDIVLRLAEAFWPGPLTLLLPRPKGRFSMATAHRPLAGVRIPAHPLFREVIQKTGKLIAAPSANLSGRPSPTRAGHVRDDFGDRIPLILDGGASEAGLESTVLDPLSHPPRILRPGVIGLPELQNFWPEIASSWKDGAVHEAESPGLKYRHYAPSKPLILLKNEPLHGELLLCFEDELERYQGQGAVTLSLGHKSAESAGRNLFSALREAEKRSQERILIVPFPNTLEWDAVNNRLNRALQGDNPSIPTPAPQD